MESSETLHLPVEESKKRIATLQELLQARALDCALIYYDELAIANGWYLSGWCPRFESGMVFVPREGDAAILGGPESEPFAKSDSAIKDTRNVSVFMVPEEEYPNATILTFAEALRELSGGKPSQESVSSATTVSHFGSTGAWRGSLEM